MLRAVIDIETVKLESDDHNTEDSKKSSSLDPLKSRIVCIGLMEVNDFKAFRMTSFMGLEEKEVLQDLWTNLKQKKLWHFIAHNGLAFDFPFLWKRSVI